MTMAVPREKAVITDLEVDIGTSSTYNVQTHCDMLSSQFVRSGKRTRRQEMETGGVLTTTVPWEKQHWLLEGIPWPAQVITVYLG